MQETHPERYARAVRVLHWSMALLIIGMLAAGLVMTSLAKDDPIRGTIYFWHKSFGVLLLCLAAVRLMARLQSFVPPLPLRIPAWQRRIAHLSHYAFYGFFFALPLSGILMSQSFGFAVPFFGVPLPRIFPPDRAMAENAEAAHAWLAYALMALIGLHAAGVIKHWLAERINLLKRMW